MTTSRTPFIVLIGVALVLLIAGLAVPKKSTTPPAPPPPPADARAVVLNGDGTARTIVIPACGSTAPTAQGQVKFQLTGTRTVLIPDCSAPANPAPGAPQQSSALVLPVGADKLIDRTLQVGTRQQVLVPAQSKAATIIVPACVKGATVRPNAKRQDVIISPATGDSATAPAC